jgi:hypothetical protein
MMSTWKAQRMSSVSLQAVRVSAVHSPLQRFASTRARVRRSPGIIGCVNPTMRSIKTVVDSRNGADVHDVISPADPESPPLNTRTYAKGGSTEVTHAHPYPAVRDNDRGPRMLPLWRAAPQLATLTAARPHYVTVRRCSQIVSASGGAPATRAIGASRDCSRVSPAASANARNAGRGSLCSRMPPGDSIAAMLLSFPDPSHGAVSRRSPRRYLRRGSRRARPRGVPRRAPSTPAQLSGSRVPRTAADIALGTRTHTPAASPRASSCPSRRDRRPRRQVGRLRRSGLRSGLRSVVRPGIGVQAATDGSAS